jgi:putative oxidoreductase
MDYVNRFPGKEWKAMDGGSPSAFGQTGNPGSAAWASVVLRCVLAAIFIAHGLQKLADYGWSGGVANFGAWGIPWPELTYRLTVVVELAGGVLLLLGIWVRAISTALAVIMLVALFAVHIHYGFFLPNGIEFVLVLAAANAALVLLGPGRWSLERRLPARLSIEQWLAGR